MSDTLNSMLEQMQAEAFEKAHAAFAEERKEVERKAATAYRQAEEARTVADKEKGKRQAMYAKLLEVADKLEGFSDELRAALQ